MLRNVMLLLQSLVRALSMRRPPALLQGITDAADGDAPAPQDSLHIPPHRVMFG